MRSGHMRRRLASLSGLAAQCSAAGAATLQARSANLDWLAEVQAAPPEQRGFALPARSRTYECAAADTAASAATWNDGRVHYDAAAAAHHFAGNTRRVKRKVVGSQVLVTRDVHKCMRQ